MKSNFLRLSGLFIGIVLGLIPFSFAYASGSASIASLSPGTSTSVGQPITFTVSTSGFTSPYYTLSDNFSGSSVASGDLNSNGTFSWTPVTNDIGSHELTILVNDNSGDAATVVQDITVGGPTSASIQSISPGATVNSGQQLSFIVSSTGITNPVYTVTDNFSGSTVASSDLNGSAFYWTPQVSDAGTHTLTATVTGGGGTASATATIVVNAVPTVSVANVSGASFPYGTAVDLTVSTQGFTSPTYSLSDSYQGSTLNSSDIATNGILVWTPQSQDVGPHSVTFYANDSSGHSASQQYNFNVTSGSAAATTTTTTTTSYAASGLTPTQASAIISLLQSFGVDQGTINTVSAILNGGSAATTPSTTTSTTPAYTFTEYLAPGSQDNEVLMLQDLLQQQGLLSATPNGYFGDATEAAVLAFQAAHGIDQLGVVGPSTRAALNAIEGGTSTGASTSSTTKVGDGYVFQNPINPGDSDNDVTELQTRLTALGIYSGPITGYYGDLTTAAVTQFQSNNSISTVGYVGPATMAALNAQ